MEFKLKIDYYKPESGKWYTEHKERFQADTLLNAVEETWNRFRFEKEWPGLSTRDHFVAIVRIKDLPDLMSHSFMFDPRRYE
jgi:hypothetical protein